MSNAFNTKWQLIVINTNTHKLVHHGDTSYDGMFKMMEAVHATDFQVSENGMRVIGKVCDLDGEYNYIWFFTGADSEFFSHAADTIKDKVSTSSDWWNHDPDVDGYWESFGYWKEIARENGDWEF